jgi:hypothetical protein
MAARKPLVLVAGQIQQIQAGDSLNASITENETQQWTNGDVGGHAIGDVVYLSGADTAKKAKADSSTTVPPVAIALATFAAAAVGSYQTTGTIGGLSGLTAGSVYYLSATTAGQMTTSAPSTAGQYVVELGVAVSTTEFLLRPRAPILL